MVDTISSLASIDFKHDVWGVDVTIGCSQKGLMLPPGLGLNAISDKALEASKSSRFSKSYWDWEPMMKDNQSGFFPYTPSTNLLYGLRESLHMLFEEGLENVFARHHRLGEATRRAVRAWGLEILCLNPEEYSNSLTAVLMPDGYNADEWLDGLLEVVLIRPIQRIASARKSTQAERAKSDIFGGNTFCFLWFMLLLLHAQRALSHRKKGP